MVKKKEDVDIDEDVMGELMKEREVEVVNEIRIGRQKKVIDYEIGMREGKVKENVNKIMKKIGEEKRKEVDCMMKKMYGKMKKEN